MPGHCFRAPKPWHLKTWPRDTRLSDAAFSFPPEARDSKLHVCHGPRIVGYFCLTVVWMILLKTFPLLATLPILGNHSF